MDKEIIIKGKKIFYRVHGNGKPVMLVHGFGETGDIWANQIEPPPTPPKEELTEDSLMNQFMFIVPDLPGAGQSEMIEDMSIEGMAEVIKAIFDKENHLQPFPFEDGLNKAILIGHSMGGYITLAFAEKYPAMLSGIGLFHSTAFPDTEEKKATRRKGIEFIQKHGAFEFIKNTTPNLFSSVTKEQDPGLVDQFIQSMKDKCSANALIAYYEAMMKRPARTAVLQNTSIPMLFIMGEYDTAVPMQDVLQQSHLPEKSYIHILHQSGHMGMLEEKEKSRHILDHFLSDLY